LGLHVATQTIVDPARVSFANVADFQIRTSKPGISFCRWRNPAAALRAGNLVAWLQGGLARHEAFMPSLCVHRQ
jgi:hypothetical protein